MKEDMTAVSLQGLLDHPRLVPAAIVAIALAALLWQFGPPIRTFIEKHLPLLAGLFFVLLFGGFLAIRSVL